MNQFQRPDSDGLRHRIADDDYEDEETHNEDWGQLHQSPLTNGLDQEDLTLEAPFGIEGMLNEPDDDEAYESSEQLPFNGNDQTQEVEALPRRDHFGVPTEVEATAEESDVEEITSANELDYYVRIYPKDNKFGGATFKEREHISIGSERDSDIFVPHDLVDGTHAEITFKDGLFYVHTTGGNSVLINNDPIRRKTVLCRGDDITLVGPGGPAFVVEMLKPDREPRRGGQALPGVLRIFSWLIEPTANRLAIPPLALFIFISLTLIPFSLGIFLICVAVFGPTA